MGYEVTMSMEEEHNDGVVLVGEPQADGSSLFRVKAEHLIQLNVTNIGRKNKISMTYVCDQGDEEIMESDIQLETGEVYRADPLKKYDGECEDSYYITHTDKTTSTFRFTLTPEQVQMPSPEPKAEPNPESARKRSKLEA